MAENTEVGLLFNVDLEASDTLKRLAELKLRAALSEATAEKHHFFMKTIEKR